MLISLLNVALTHHIVLIHRGTAEVFAGFECFNVICQE